MLALCRPWQFAVVNVDDLPVADSVSGVFPLKLSLHGDVRQEGEAPTSLTSLLVSVDPVFYDADPANLTVGKVRKHHATLMHAVRSCTHAGQLGARDI